MSQLAPKSMLILSLLLFMMVTNSEARVRGVKRIKTEVFLSPKIELEPGQVSNKVYYNVDFPKGHIGIKSFDAELVDDEGNPAPLYDVYLHHWVVVKSHTQINNRSNRVIIGNSGVCSVDSGLIQHFGLGSETRKTRNDIPDPYGIEAGNPADAPKGYQEGWILNVHAIDTRGVVDRRRCLECDCDLYSNITMTAPLPKSYGGGLSCCTDGARCKMMEGYTLRKRSLYLKYTVKYVEWDASVVPVKVYVLDVADLWTKGTETTGNKAKHNCQVEYDVEACPDDERRRKGHGCIDSKTLKFDFEHGGDVIYGLGHLHLGGRAMALYGEGGREICTSYPKYGNGKEAGNEAGYVVGMSTCYPRPGSVKISSGEMLTIVSNYSSTVRHTGVMGLVYLLVADSTL